MAVQHARSWWDEVDEVRERIERRRAASAGAVADPRPAGRRTVRIEGRGAPPPAIEPLRNAMDEPSPTPSPRATGPAFTPRRPDRILLWAVLLGFVLVLVAVASAGAAARSAAPAWTATAATGGSPRLQGPDPLAVPAASRTRPMRTRVVSWYGPGWYGRRTYCGQVLTSKLLGTAHRTLPCGTKVRFSYRGRSIVARVVDRGDLPARIDYDVTWAVAKYLRILRIGIATVKADR